MPVRDSSSRPQRQGYSFANQGAATIASGGAAMGKHVLRRVPGVDFWTPAWGEETVIRCLPAVSPVDSSQFDPFRLSTNFCDFGDWLRVYEAVRNFGNPGITMLLHNGLNPSYDAQLMNPCWLLYRAINQALSQGQGRPEWVPLTKGGQGRGPQLSKPTKLYLTQCFIFRYKSKDTFGSGRPPLGGAVDGPTIVMGLPPTAGENLVQLLEEREEDWKGDPNDINQYKYGDLVGTEAGSFVHIYELGKDPRSRFNTARAGSNPASIYAGKSARGGASMGGAAMESKGYGVFITKTLDGNPGDIPASLSGLEDLAKSKWRPWESILEFKSDEEQARMVAQLFPPSVILYAWRDHRSWIPDEVREAGDFEDRKPTSLSAPAQPSGGGNPWTRKQSVQPVQPPATDFEVEGAPTESLGDDIALPQSDMPQEDVDRVQEAKSRLEAANKRAAQRASKGV